MIPVGISKREDSEKVQGEARMFNVIEKWWHDMMCLFFYIEFMIINYPRAWDAGGRSCGKIARDSWANIFSSAWSTVHRVKPYDVARCFCGKRVCTWCMNELKIKSLSFVEQTKPRNVKKSSTPDRLCVPSDPKSQRDRLYPLVYPFQS